MERFMCIKEEVNLKCFEFSCIRVSEAQTPADHLRFT